MKKLRGLEPELKLMKNPKHLMLIKINTGLRLCKCMQGKEKSSQKNLLTLNSLSQR